MAALTRPFADGAQGLAPPAVLQHDLTGDGDLRVPRLLREALGVHKAHLDLRQGAPVARQETVDGLAQGVQGVDEDGRAQWGVEPRDDRRGLRSQGVAARAGQVPVDVVTGDQPAGGDEGAQQQQDEEPVDQGPLDALEGGTDQSRQAIHASRRLANRRWVRARKNPVNIRK